MALENYQREIGDIECGDVHPEGLGLSALG